MPSPVAQHQPNYAFKMMERLGIDPSGAVVPRLSLLYATASHRLRWPRNVRQDLGNLRENPARWVNRLEAQSA
jgi:hypothetical protein